jgi:hypothetical protein
MHVARIQLGVVGTDPTGKPIEMVIVEYSLGNGYHATVDWEFDADDRAMAQQLADHYEPKIKEMQQGNQSFQPTAQTLGFEPDKATP